MMFELSLQIFELFVWGDQKLLYPDKKATSLSRKPPLGQQTPNLCKGKPIKQQQLVVVVVVIIVIIVIMKSASLRVILCN